MNEKITTSHQSIILSQESIYLLAFFLWQVNGLIATSTFDLIEGFSILRRCLQIVALLMISINILLSIYSLGSLTFFLLGSICFLYSAVVSGRFTYIAFFLFVFSVRELDFEKLLKICYCSLLVAFPIIILSNLLGFIKDSILVNASISLINRFNGGERIALGFYHPNTLGCRVFELVALHTYLNRRDLRLKDFIIVFIAMVFVYRVPNCQSASAYCGFLLIIMLLYKYGILRDYSDGMIMNVGLTIAAIFCNLYSVIIGILGPQINRIVYLIDVWASSRLYFSHQVVSHYGVSLFGKEINVGRFERGVRYDFTFFDNGYLNILIVGGIIAFVIMSVTLIGSIWRFSSVDIVLACILSIYAIDGLMTNNFMDIDLNPFIIAFGLMRGMNERIREEESYV